MIDIRRGRGPVAVRSRTTWFVSARSAREIAAGDRSNTNENGYKRNCLGIARYDILLSTLPTLRRQRPEPALRMLKILPALAMLRILPAPAILRTLPVLPILRTLPALAMLNMLPALPILKMLPALAMLNLLLAFAELRKRARLARLKDKIVRLKWLSIHELLEYR
jgi:hypothetical protein